MEDHILMLVIRHGSSINNSKLPRGPIVVLSHPAPASVLIDGHTLIDIGDKRRLYGKIFLSSVDDRPSFSFVQLQHPSLTKDHILILVIRHDLSINTQLLDG